MSHNFLPSIKKGVSYCKKCGCLSYKNIPSKNILSHNNNAIKIIMDPLILKYRPISLDIDFSLLSHNNYIGYRKKGLSKIYFLCNNFNLGSIIMYKAIGLMDQIFLNNKDIYIENIEIIASICILISYQFNECCSKPNKIELNSLYIKNIDSSCKHNLEFINNNNYYYVNSIKGLHQYLKDKIKNIVYWQIFCLKKLNYNLDKYSAFDYINLFFGLGILFTDEQIDIISEYKYCIFISSILINQYNICKYNQYVIAMSIIYIAIKDNKYFDQNIFKYIYGVDFSKQKYNYCINELNKIINYSFHLNYYDNFLISNQYINSFVNYFNYNNINNRINNNKNNNFSKNNNCKNINEVNNSFFELLEKYNFWFEKSELYNNENIIKNIEKLKLYYNYFYSINFSRDLIRKISLMCINKDANAQKFNSKRNDIENEIIL